ncbi:hypothetical protein D3C73_1390330 [compost metagenome]
MTQILLQSPWDIEISDKLGLINKKTNMVLRVGYMNSLPKPVSQRRPISEIII